MFKTYITLFFILLSATAHSMGGGDIALLQILANSTKEIAELRELITEAKETNEALDKMNEYVEKAQHEADRVHRLQLWAESMASTDLGKVGDLSQLNSAIRELKGSREELLDIIDRHKELSVADEKKVTKSTVSKKDALKRAVLYSSSGSGLADSQLGASNKVGINTQAISYETALVNAKLSDIHVTLLEQNKILREGLIKKAIEKSSGKLLGEEFIGASKKGNKK